MDDARKFLALDALRGVAALAVVEFHTHRAVFRHGYLAVDFFFMLSGFVLTFAYQGRLDAGWPTREFLKVRFIRLYPLYLLGLGLGAGLRIIDIAIGRPSPSAVQMLTLGLAGLLVLPAPVQFEHVSAYAFPFNIPSWSLFFEALANVFHAVVLRRRTWRFLAGMTAASGLAFYAWALHTGRQDMGGHRVEVLPGLARVVFSYTAGVLLFRLWQTGRVRWRVPPVVAAAALVLLLMGPPPQWGHMLGYDLAVTLVCFPPLLLVSAASQPSLRFARVFQGLGVASYAIYVLHVPLAAAYFSAMRVPLRAMRMAESMGWETLGFLVLICAAALGVDGVYDRPVRRMMQRRWNDGAERRGTQL